MFRFDRVANVAVIITCIIVCGFTLYERVFRPTQDRPHDLASLVGKPLSLPESLPVGRNGTITLIVSKSCKYCAASMDFYRRLATSKPTGVCDVKLVAVGPRMRDSPDELREYLDQQGVSIDGIDTVRLAALGIFGTPAVVLRDSSSVVRHVWGGKLEEKKEDEVIAAVKALCKS